MEERPNHGALVDSDISRVRRRAPLVLASPSFSPRPLARCLICPGGPRCRALYDFRDYFSMAFRFFRAAPREALHLAFSLARKAKQESRNIVTTSLIVFDTSIDFHVCIFLYEVFLERQTCRKPVPDYVDLRNRR